MAKGNPNPSPSTRIGAPNGPKPGTTSEARRMEIQNAEAAMRIRERILRAAEARLVECSTEQVLEEFVEAAMLKLIKDSEDRGMGAPVQPHTSPDGSMTPQIITRTIIDPKKDDSP